MPDAHDLERLAKQGRAERAKHEADEAAAREAAVVYENAKEAAERRKTFRASASWAGAFWASGMAYVLGMFGFIGLPLLGTMAFGMSERHALLWLLLPLVSAGALWMAFGLFVAPGRERAWAKRLPFELKYYEATLGVYPKDLARKIVLQLRFMDTGPETAQLCDILASDGGTWKQGGKGLERSELGMFDSGTNITVRNWFHRFAGKQLATLHASYPIRSVRLVTLETLGKEFVERARHLPE